MLTATFVVVLVERMMTSSVDELNVDRTDFARRIQSVFKGAIAVRRVERGSDAVRIEQTLSVTVCQVGHRIDRGDGRAGKVKVILITRD